MPKKTTKLKIRDERGGYPEDIRQVFKGEIKINCDQLLEKIKEIYSERQYTGDQDNY